MLRAYCDAYHEDRDPDKPLFYTRTGKFIDPSQVWHWVKDCARRIGLDPKKVRTHCIRGSFKKVLSATPEIDKDTEEFLMGHSLGSTRAGYFYDVKVEEEVKEKRLKANFNRKEPDRQVMEELKTLREKVQELEIYHRIFEGIKASQKILKKYVESNHD